MCTKAQPGKMLVGLEFLSINAFVLKSCLSEMERQAGLRERVLNTHGQEMAAVQGVGGSQNLDTRLPCEPALHANVLPGWWAQEPVQGCALFPIGQGGSSPTSP